MTGKGITSICGISDAQVAPVAAHISHERKGQCLIITGTSVRAERLAGDLSFFTDKNICVLPDEEYIQLDFEAKNHEVLLKRMAVLKQIAAGDDIIVIAPVCAALKKLPPKESYGKNSFALNVGDTVDMGDIREKLSAMGYERFSMIDGPGQFAVRGDILDIFAPGMDLPYRIEFYDTDVDSIRLFNLETQRSEENIERIEIYPAAGITSDREVFETAEKNIRAAYEKQIRKTKDEELKEALRKHLEKVSDHVLNLSNVQMLENYLQYFYDDICYLWDYMNDPAVMVDEPDKVLEILKDRADIAAQDFKAFLDRGMAVPEDAGMLLKASDMEKVYSLEEVYVFSPFMKRIKGIDEYRALYDLNARNTLVFSGHLDLLETEIKRYLKNGFEITIACSSEERRDNLKEFLSRAGLDTKVSFKLGELTSGFEFPEQRKVWISDGDIFTTTKKKRKRKNREIVEGASPIRSFADISEGDFVVHENHGIGKFLGIKQLTSGTEKKDYLQIKYSGKDLLYVPVEQMDMIQKYSGSDGVTPKINSLNGTEWKKTKAKAKAAIAEMATELIELNAARKMAGGHAFSTDTEWQKDFEDSFPYAETDDQLRCIKEIKKDMEENISMDRLLCGDVGFGKTEVAARALFKCVADGKQAAVLVPTTILANQHYYTLKERFERFPFKVEVLSRFKTDAQVKEILEKLEAGQVDLIIGTHRLLSDDVRFKDLGLLVIDEEQRFGVMHKEKIKKLKSNVDVLTLSATPIPRTLHMSMSGIRDMSVISQPPEDRYPVQTYVVEQDDMSIRSAIERELARGGQVYVVYNRVNGINQVASKIEKLVPDAEVAVGHGRMSENQLEKIMLGFIEGETNVLVATTIIESGLDIPNVNTIIVLDTDRFGLSQLYQLRGRVGRTNRMAYAYLMYQPGKVLTEIAQKRLKAIKEFTEFGSGFKVAMRDLEIRGAGNVLGTAQSGHMMNIGYELYCKLVNDAVRALNGEIVNDSKEETLVELKNAAYIPDEYIRDHTLKLHTYKKIAEIYTSGEQEDMIDELIDRFGDIPSQVTDLIKISRIRKLAQDEFIERVCEEHNKVVFYFSETNRLTGPMLFKLSEKYGVKVFFHGGVRPFMRLTTERKTKLDEVIEFLQTMKELRGITAEEIKN